MAVNASLVIFWQNGEGYITNIKIKKVSLNAHYCSY